MKTTWIRSKALLADERGTMIEIPITIALICVVLAVAVRQPTLGRAVLAASIAAALFLGALAALVGVGFLLGWVSEVRWVKRVMESKVFAFFAEWAPWFLLALFMGAAGCFFGLVLADASNQPPSAQVRTGIISGVVLAALPILYRVFGMRGSKPVAGQDGPKAHP